LQHVSIQKSQHEAKYLLQHIKGYSIKKKMKSQFGKSNFIAFCIFLLSISQMMTHVAINNTNKSVSAVFIPLIKLQNLAL